MAQIVLATAATIALLYFGRVFLITMVIAVMLAFILEPAVQFFQRMRMPRGVASFVACSIALLFLYLAGLGIYSQVAGLAAELPKYGQRITELTDGVLIQMEELERSIARVLPKRQEKTAQPTPPPVQDTRRRTARRPDPPMPTVQEVRIQENPTPLYEHIYTYLSSLYDVLLMASFVPFLVYFMLSWRDHVRRTFMQMFHGPERVVAGRSWEGIAYMARAYVVGNFLLGLVLAAVSTVFFVAVRLPYPLLIGPLSGFLSLVPYVGLPLAIVPPLFAALPVYTQIGWYAGIAAVVALLHLLALNLLYPKFVGGRVHLNPLVVTIALMFWGTIWGGIGLVLAIPITAGVKAVCDNVTGLQPYGRLLGD